MVTKRFNFIFKDGCEYEVAVYEGGGICIKSDFGGKILELGHYQMLDVLEILDRIGDELKASDKGYDNPIEEIEEDERMELDQGEIAKALNDCAGEFMDLELFSDWTEEDKANTCRFLVELYNVWAVGSIMKAEIVKLNRMAEEETEQ